MMWLAFRMGDYGGILVQMQNQKKTTRTQFQKNTKPKENVHTISKNIKPFRQLFEMLYVQPENAFVFFEMVCTFFFWFCVFLNGVHIFLLVLCFLKRSAHFSFGFAFALICHRRWHHNRKPFVCHAVASAAQALAAIYISRQMPIFACTTCRKLTQSTSKCSNIVICDSDEKHKVSA